MSWKIEYFYDDSTSSKWSADSEQSLAEGQLASL